MVYCAASVCVCVRTCVVQCFVGCAYVLEKRAASIFRVKLSRSSKCSGCIGKRPFRLKEGEVELGPIPRDTERRTENCENRPISGPLLETETTGTWCSKLNKEFFDWRFRHFRSTCMWNERFRLHRRRRIYVWIQFSVKWITFLWVLQTQWRNKFDKLSSY
jgi:hypothetical protein